MCCDLGEPHITTSAEWAEDEVASSSKIDSWAQGAISKTFHAKLLDRVISPTKHDEAKLCDSKIIKRKDIISDGKNKDDSGMNVDQRSIESIAKHDKPQKKVLNKDYNRKPIEQRTFTSRRIKSSIDDPQLISCKTEVLSEAEDISSKNKFIVDKQAGNTISKKRTKPIVKQISEAMLLSKRTSGSGKLIFDDEGNLISVPKLHPVNNKHSESTTAVGGYLEVNGSNPLGNKIPVQWRFLTNSLDSTTHHRFELTSTTKKFRTARSSMSTKTNKTRSRNRSFDSTEQTISPDLIRLQRIKNACGNVTNTIDLVDLVSGVTISDGEHLKIGRSTNEQFSSILNTNWDDLEEIPPVKVK
ncbi:unnamed protein product [Heterobilharzia americana]|nr:unnamed protein product [Heterobilharzia americana]